MKTIIGFVLIAGMTWQVMGQTPTPTPKKVVLDRPPGVTDSVAPRKMLLFRPPAVTDSVLPMRVGGGSRGGKSDVKVEVLVPEHVALTVQAQPTLYWYQDKDAAAGCEITVTEPKNPKPLIVLHTKAPTPAGIHAIRLAKYPTVQLKSGVVYKWSVAVVFDPTNRSEDVVANGVIQRIDPSTDLAAKLKGASVAEKTSAYADAGIWYDALQGISDQIDHSPNDSSLKDQRDSLLKQIDLAVVSK